MLVVHKLCSSSPVRRDVLESSLPVAARSRQQDNLRSCSVLENERYNTVRAIRARRHILISVIGRRFNAVSYHRVTAVRFALPPLEIR